MNPVRLLLCFLATLGTLGGQPVPTLSAQDGRGNPVPLKIALFEAEVLIFEDLAQTTLTVSFQNPTNRNIEGVFSLPLPPGVTISGYQLEVNGKMRNSTAVEKARARFAYESIKRQNIDPGYIERQPGNIYRTRIFPIPGKSTKAVSVTFCQPLTQFDDHQLYHLLLPAIPVTKAKINIRHLQQREVKVVAPSAEPSSSWILFTKDDSQTLLSKEALTLDQLSLRLQPLEKDFVVQLPDYTYRHSTRKGPTPLPVPEGSQTIDLVWECSESRGRQDHSREFAYLKKLFQQHPDLSVRLTRLSWTTGKREKFEVRQGDWEKLRAALKNVFYDGGTDLGSWRPQGAPTLLFTDGRSYHSRLKSPWKHPVTLIDATGKADSYWIDQATASGGTYLDLARERLNHAAVNRQFSAHKKSKGKVSISDEASQIIKTMWASEKLRALQNNPSPDHRVIAEFSKRHHLVSDETSLIVLERFEDHLRYRIPPPEPELLAKYHGWLHLEKNEPTAKQRLAKRWKIRGNWYAKDFPWQNHALQPTLGRIAIWKRALLKTFDVSELNQDSLDKVEEVKAQIDQLNREKATGELDTLSKYEAWQKSFNQASQNLLELKSLPFGRKAKGQMAIGVHGFVNQRGKLVVDPKTNLKQALKKAGGLSKIGSPSRVAIYRGANKTTYNLYSKEYTEVKLQAGDLIAVEMEDHHHYGYDDPFAEESYPEPDYQNEPAIVVSDGTSRAKDDSTVDDPFADGPGPAHKDLGPASNFPVRFLEDQERADFERLAKQLEGEADAMHLYRSFRPRHRQSDDFYLRLGDLFLKHQKPKIAQQILSNLIETPSPRPTAYRKWSYLLARHGRWDEALDLSQRAARHAPEDLAIRFDLAWLLVKTGQGKDARDQLQGIQANFFAGDDDSARLAEIAKAHEKSAPEKEALDLRVIVVSASGNFLDLKITEPGELVTSLNESEFPSQMGARALASAGVAEYSLRQAMPGEYQLSLSCPSPQIVRVQIYRHWGKENETCEERVLLVPLTQSRRLLQRFRFDFE